MAAVATLAALCAGAGVAPPAGVPAASPPARRSKVLLADCKVLEKFLYSESEGKQPFMFHGYEDVDSGASPQGPLLLLNASFLRNLLAVVPSAELSQSQIVGCLGPVLKHMVKTQGRQHPCFGGADVLDKSRT